MTNTPFNKACFMISCGYGFMGSSTLQQQAIHLVFGTDEGMVREKASGIFAALTEGTNEFSHEILEAACGDSDEAAQIPITQVIRQNDNHVRRCGKAGLRNCRSAKQTAQN